MKMTIKPELIYCDPKVKIVALQSHHEAVRIFAEAGHGYPTIPAGINTVLHHFITRDGHHAVIVNQKEFVPVAEDNEQPVNGCLLLIALEPVDDQTAREALDKVIRDLLEMN
jgi:hypothetical protein